MCTSNEVEVIVNTGNSMSLYDYNQGMKLFDLSVYNKVVGRSNILIYFPIKIRSINPRFIRGFCHYWLDNYSIEWIKNNVSIYPERLEKMFYEGLDDISKNG